jgi:hypothetical protein
VLFVLEAAVLKGTGLDLLETTSQVRYPQQPVC